jgi:hypothetical protein
MANALAPDLGTTRHRERSIIVIAALCVSASLASTSVASAQGISTVAIRGTVRSEDGASVEGAAVRVLNTATGFAVSTQVGRGRFLVYGLDAGGPYVVDVRHVGFVPQRIGPVMIPLGEPVELHVVLRSTATSLDRVVVTGVAPGASVHGSGGAATFVADSLLHRLPTSDRGFLDFVQLAPQVSTKIGSQRRGISAAGANLRYNTYLVDGADERFVNGNVSAANSLGKSVPIDAVKEYQVLLAPYDVRYGDFAGALVNTVTRSGTNELHGSAFAYWRNDRLARGSGLAAGEPYERVQYGLSLGGPIVRDRVHFFVAPEIQRLTSPAPGPYIGQPTSAERSLPVSAEDVARFERIMSLHGLTAGSGGPVEISSPLRNLFARVDAAIPWWSSRAIGFVSYAGANDDVFSRGDRFYLSSARFTQATALRLFSMQLHTDLPRVAGVGGTHNELVLSHSTDWSDPVPSVRQPLVRVEVAGVGGGFVPLFAGTDEQAQGRSRRSRAIKVKDELTVPWSARNVLVIGVQAERFLIQPEGVTNGYGTWTFSSLDDFELGDAEQFTLRKDLGGASAPLRGGQYAAYAGDEWLVGDRLSLTFGVRADLMDIDGSAPYNAAVDSVFGRRTDLMPRARVHLSPRVGFTWDLAGTGRDVLRGGVGVFTGRPLLAWLHPALASYGAGVGVLSCGSRATDAGPPPTFVPEYSNAPTACARGPGVTTIGDVDLLDRNLRMAQALRGSLAYERRLPWGLLSTSEVLATRYRSDFVFVNMNLVGPQSVDRFGRVIYGRIGANGANEPALRSTTFSEVIDLRNTSRNYSYQLSTRIERRFAQGMAASTSYTFSRTRDVQSPSRVNTSGLAIWGDARAVSGLHDDQARGVSLNDVPHRVVAALTYTAPWSRWTTDVSFYYVGESGSPFTYRAGGANRRGDLNADGSNANDPIYVPQNALDTLEIRFSGRSDSLGADNSTGAQAYRERLQQEAFEHFVAGSSCLRRYRGRIVERNGCREPWSHTTVASVRQAVPVGERVLETELGVSNVLNLLNGGWGRYRVADPVRLEHVGQRAGPPETAQPTFRFDATRPEWTTLTSASAFQLQLSMRYRF